MMLSRGFSILPELLFKSALPLVSEKRRIAGFLGIRMKHPHHPFLPRIY